MKITILADAYTGQQTQVAEVALGQAEEGKPVLRFDILTGDQLFVDRFSYHFFRPAPGHPVGLQGRIVGHH